MNNGIQHPDYRNLLKCDPLDNKVDNNKNRQVPILFLKINTKNALIMCKFVKKSQKCTK